MQSRGFFWIIPSSDTVSHAVDYRPSSWGEGSAVIKVVVSVR